MYDKIQIVNEYNPITGEEVQKAVRALQVQVTRDFCPLWNMKAPTLEIVSRENLSKDAPWIVILDNSDQAGALGYHDLTNTGMPLGKVFAGSDKRHGYNWTVTLSHELLELLADPHINKSVTYEGRMYAVEVADACEADEFAYKIDDVMVSDFVTPSFFGTEKKPQYDFKGYIQKPLQLLKGGYIGYYENGSWHQLTAESYTAEEVDTKTLLKARPPVGSRRERRTVRNHLLSEIS